MAHDSSNNGRRNATRRQFLRGAGGYALGLPFLPSLASSAFAADPVAPVRKRFIGIATQHGGISDANMYPAAKTLTGSASVLPGHDMHWGALVPTDDGTNNALSPVLRAPKTLLTAKLIGKMNVINGLDIPFYMGHQTGAHLGNFHARTEIGSAKTTPGPTIDQVMAWSPSFYKSLTGIKVRSLVTGQSFRGISWDYSNPSARSGDIQAVKVESSSKTLFDRLFGAGTTAPAGTARPKPVVDLVLEDYKRLRNGDRRLSTSDKRRLDEHLERMAELQRSIMAAQAPPPLSCTMLVKPTDDSTSATKEQVNGRGVAQAKQFYSLLNKVVVQAMACGSSQIASIYVGLTFSDYAGNWHQDIAHRHTAADAQKTLSDALQLMFQNVFVDLASQLDAIDEGQGTTLLDNTLLQWTQEAGRNTHDTLPIPVVTAGSAGGFLKTGNFVDYRNVTAGHQYGVYSPPTADSIYSGILWRQWLTTALTAMGVPASEWQKGDVKGFGDPYYDPAFVKFMTPGLDNIAGDVVPFLKRA